MRVVALEYHDVVEQENWESSGFPGNSAASYKMDAVRFAQHLDAVAASEVPVLNDVRALSSAPVSSSDRSVLISFDDGGSSALHPTADILEEHGWRGHFLVTTGKIGTPGFLDQAAIVALHRRGHIIGSHTETHPARMSLVSPADQLVEWQISRAKLEAILGTAMEVASVPGGYFDRQVAEIAAAAGIRWLFTSEPESRVEMVDGCAVIGRYTLRRASPPAVARALVSAGPRARAGQWLAWNAKKLAKRVAGDTYLRLRASAFRESSGGGDGHKNR